MLKTCWQVHASQTDPKRKRTWQQIASDDKYFTRRRRIYFFVILITTEICSLSSSLLFAVNNHALCMILCFAMGWSKFSPWMHRHCVVGDKTNNNYYHYCCSWGHDLTWQTKQTRKKRENSKSDLLVHRRAKFTIWREKKSFDLFSQEDRNELVGVSDKQRYLWRTTCALDRIKCLRWYNNNE